MMGGPNAKLLRQMQAQLAKIQEELAEETVEATAGGGAVKVVMTGQQRVRAVQLDPAALDPEDVELLQDMIVAAMNEALAKSQELAARRLSALTGGLKLPGMF
ncbi:MAG TPA: YbaB/EbfC family nucleoid-associated protein [Chloroflexota bacterium]|nr:YbaB/EbfC family nucleoid-associated protein [Chloroflexota bacterium]